MAMYLRICLHGGAEGRKELYGNDNLKGYLGITEILKVELMHRIADTYGPLVYHQLGETPWFTDSKKPIHASLQTWTKGSN